MNTSEIQNMDELEAAEGEMAKVLSGLYPNIDEETLANSIRAVRDAGRLEGKGELSGVEIATVTLKKLAEMNPKKPEKTFLPNIPSEKK